MYVGLPCLGRVYCRCVDLSRKGTVLFYFVWTYPSRLFCTVCGLFQKGILEGLGLSGTGSLFIKCMDLPRKGTYFVQCVDSSGREFCTVYLLSRKGILNSVLAYLGVHFVQCDYLPGIIFCTVYGPT